MEFLREKFREELVAEVNKDNGEVVIAGFSFLPDSILKEMDPVGYDEAFKDWVQIRRESLLARADQVLEKYNSRERFYTLKETYTRGAVVPFIGAGMCMSSGYPSWKAFLKKIRLETAIPEGDLESMLVAGQYEEAAQLIMDLMGSVAFNEVLENSFNQNLKLAGPIQFLPYIFNTCVITTNFDNVVKRCYDAANLSFSEELLGAEAIELPRMLGAGSKVLVKLHGKSNSSKNRVLTFSEYQHHYGEEINMKGVIGAVCTKTLLFMGCSLSVDRTIQVMKEIAHENGHDRVPRHYAFLAIGEEEDRIEKARQLAEANIFPIWYPFEEDHDEILEGLLIKLSEESYD